MNISPHQRRFGLRFLTSAVIFAIATPAARADDIVLANTYTGRLQFVFVGASLVDAAGLSNGVNCLYRSASATVRTSDLPTRPRVRSAVLYVGGSLLGDDGPDYQELEIFDSDGISGIDDPEFVTTRARAAADVSVALTLPGQTTPTTIEAGSTPAITTFYKSEGTEAGNIAFFTTRFDITSLIEQNGLIAGAYTVGEVLADVCYGTEAVCDDSQRCDTVTPSPNVDTQGPHTNAAASFALLLTLEDDALPLRTIGVFEGLEQVSGTSDSITLDTVNPISTPAAGRFAFYALEGDLLLANADSAKTPCGGDEFIEVSDEGDAPALCLNDDDNPIGNIFNSTINSEPKSADGPSCSTADHLTCCGGDGLCGVTGVDIDRFNISAALTPGARRVTVRYGTASDRIALGVAVLEVDVFEPTLIADTQVRVLNDLEGRVQVGGPVVYSIAISNTGNVSATDVRVQMSGPPGATNFAVTSVPEGAVNLSNSGGGDNSTGLVFVHGFDVPAGQIREIRVEMETACNALSRTLSPTATVSSAEISAFTVEAERVEVSGPGTGACEGLDPTGPYGDNPSTSSQRVLRGGGGCQAAAGPLSAIVGLAFVTALLRKRRRGDA